MQVEKVYEGKQVEIFRVSPQVYFRRADLARRQCNSVYIVGASGVAVVDAPTVEAAAEFDDETKRLFGKPVTTVLLTHGDDDHVDGLPAFLDRDVTVFCSRRLYDRLAPAGQGRRASFAAVEVSVPLCLSGGVEVELFTLQDITHSHWDMFVRIPAIGALCTGDAVVEYQTLYFQNANTGTWSAQLKKLAAQPGEIVLPGHGPIYPYSYVGEVAEYIDGVYRAAQNCMGRLSDEEVEDISVGRINEAISAYFAEGGPDAEMMLRNAGDFDARREVRMAMWHLIRERMR